MLFNGETFLRAYTLRSDQLTDQRADLLTLNCSAQLDMSTCLRWCLPYLLRVCSFYSSCCNGCQSGRSLHLAVTGIAVAFSVASERWRSWLWSPASFVWRQLLLFDTLNRPSLYSCVQLQKSAVAWTWAMAVTLRQHTKNWVTLRCASRLDVSAASHTLLSYDVICLWYIWSVWVRVYPGY